MPYLLLLSLFLTGPAYSGASGLAAADQYIVASAGPGGEIKPEGRVKVKRFRSKTFEINPDAGYDILDVLVDGVSVGPVDKYKFSFVYEDHTIHASFIKKKFTITASAGVGGDIDPSGEVSVDRGKDKTFDISADRGFLISDVVVDKVSLGPLDAYKFEDVQSDHSIEARFRRSLELIKVSIPNVSMKIGDVVPLTIEVGDDGGSAFSLVSGTVGGYILEHFERISSTVYQADFTIIEGGNSYTAPQDIPVTNLVISNGDEMTRPYEDPIVQDNDPIDAQAPVVSRMEVPSEALGVGTILKVTISADSSSYALAPGTLIHGIPLSSSRISLLDLGNGLYEASMVIEAGDAEVAPGLLEASIIMMDEAGNISNTYNIIESNTLEIYTALPEADLVGPLQICEGEEVELSVHLRGRAPWSFDLDDGTNITTFSDITSPDYKITVAPFRTTTFVVSAVRDVNGVENTDNGSLVLTVDEVDAVEIINLASGYDVEAEEVLLEANIPGGVFSGPGVISSTGYFYPSVADTINSPHTLYYTYTNDNGCVSVDSALVYVLGNEGGILIPAQGFCKNGNPFEATVFNVPANDGSFSLLDANSNQVGGLVDHGNNTATIDPDSLEIGIYTVKYQYVDQIIHTLTKDFTIENIESPQILNLYDSAYCQNTNPFILQANLPDVVFEGQGISGNMDEGFLFDPGAAEAGNIIISCTAESENGCRATTEREILIKFTPQVTFELSSECMPEGGEMVSFINQTEDAFNVESWSWNFGDPGSGANNQSALSDPSHHYMETGVKNITLRATSFDGCIASFTMEALIDSKPVTDFTWISDCFTEGTAVQFINHTSIGSAILDTVIWTFKDGDGAVIEQRASLSVSDTLDYLFSSADDFRVGLYTRNVGGCFSEMEKEIKLRPSVKLDSDGYIEEFDDSEGQWIAGSENQLESWVWGVPDFPGYVPQEGEKAWYTELPQGIPDYLEHSWIQSPCLDFSDVRRPVIRLDMMRSFFPYLNGAVLQYRESTNENWKTIGEDTPGLSWYNVDNIINMPGGSSIGWGLEEFIPDTSWISALHDLDPLVGKEHIDLRLAISTNGQLEVGNQGMALNSLFITERSKLSLLEHFTNYSDDTARMADDIIDAFAKNHSKDVIDLQYHTAYPGFDLMNENNPDPPSTRYGNYGIPGVPYAVLDGGVSPEHRFAYPELEGSSMEDQLRLLGLEEPAFDIDLSVNWMVTGLEAVTTVTCLADRFDENIQLYLVVFESSINSYTGPNGDQHFRNVVLDMLPTPSGKLLGDNWRKGNSDTRINMWTYQPYIEDINDLAVVAFLQDRNSERILQTAVDYKDETVGLPESESKFRSLAVYPNPARNELYLNLGSKSERAGKLEMLELSGKVVGVEELPPDHQVYQIDISHLDPGMYILRWIEAGQVRGLVKFVRMK